MIDIARREHPGLRFEVGSMTELPLADASVAGLVAFWSLIHVPDHVVPGVRALPAALFVPAGRCCSAFTSATRRR